MNFSRSTFFFPKYERKEYVAYGDSGLVHALRNQCHGLVCFSGFVTSIWNEAISVAHSLVGKLQKLHLRFDSFMKKSYYVLK